VHTAAEVAAAVALNVPAAQGVQLDAAVNPPTVPYVPAGQSNGEGEELGQYEPTGQIFWVGEPDASRQ